MDVEVLRGVCQRCQRETECLSMVTLCQLCTNAVFQGALEQRIKSLEERLGRTIHWSQSRWDTEFDN